MALFGAPDGSLLSPDLLTQAWRAAVRTHGLPPITLHALRHTHASALIAAGVDVVTISKRLGHANPAITLKVYSHLFHSTDAAAATKIDSILGL